MVHEGSDFTRLSSLGAGGRSSSTTILSLSAIKHLRETELAKVSQKLLSFTDNRQDASLQAGHFNDFVEIGILRSALYNAALDAGKNGISHESLPNAVFKELSLPLEVYSENTAPPNH